MSNFEGITTKLFENLWVIASNGFIEESEGQNPDWLGFKSLSFKRKV